MSLQQENQPQVENITNTGKGSYLWISNKHPNPTLPKEENKKTLNIISCSLLQRATAYRR